MISSTLSMIFPLLNRHIMDNGLLVSDYNVVVKYTFLSFWIIIINQGLGLLETKYRVHLSNIIPYELSKRAFKHALKMKIQFFTDTNSNELMSNISMDVRNISRVADRGAFYLIIQVFKIIGGIVGLLIINWKLTILVVCIIPFRYLLVRYLSKKRRQLFEKLMEYYREYSAWYGDTIGGIKEIRLWCLERIKIGQFIRKQRNIINAEIKLSYLDKLNELSESILYHFISNTLYILGAWMIIFQKELSIGGLFAFITYSSYVTTPISSILNIGYSFSNVLPSARRLFNFLDMECEDDTVKGNNKHLDIDSIKGHIKFDNVCFSYKSDERTIKNISFEIKPGEKVAITGLNGSGKTTLLNLLLRLYKPDSGAIYLDGIDINTINLKEYRSIISVVSQDLYLFNTTIKENITLSQSMDDVKIYKAAKESGALEFINNMPEKFQSKVGRNGSKLSGGEKQKIAVARAFARDSKILVLDEATSNYDVESESYVNELLSKNSWDKTVLVVTHKPAILKKMDKVIILDKGEIIDSGSYEHLYKSSHFFRDLLNKDDSKKNVI